MSTRDSDVNALVERSYQHGFVTDIEGGHRSARSRRGRDPADLAQEERAAVHA
jgi:hypothetical protein